MYVRKLKIKDTLYMLEWMHDSSVVEFMQANFVSKTETDCRAFIENSWADKQNYHLAICSDDDEYQGTVSLKNIRNHSAEFAITIRRNAMGKGYSLFGMKEIIQIGFNSLNLNEIYWCVSPNNKRAIRFYDKNDFQRTTYKEINIQEGAYTIDEMKKYIWYVVKKQN